jgi:flagellar biosynthetic protein FliR
MSTLLFLALNGHLALLQLLIESFGLLPPAVAGLGTAGFVELADSAGRMFEAAIMVALPAATALLVASVSMGLIARSAPQLNIFAVGFPMTLMLGIVALLFSLPLLAPQFEQLLVLVLEAGRSLLGGFR